MRRISKKFLALLLEVALMTDFFAGCDIMGPVGGPDPGEVPGAGQTPIPIDLSVPCDGILSISFVPEDALNPFTSRSRDNVAVAGLIYEGLYALGENFTAVPVLALGVTTLDGRRYTLEIQSGITFHNGERLTVEDVIYSLNRARNSTLFGGRLSIVSGYDRRYDAQGERLDYEMDIVLSRTHGNIPMLLTFPIIQRGSFGQVAPPGTGPFQFTDEYGPPRLIGFPGHWDERPLPIDTIYLAEIITIEQMTAHFNSGFLDIAALELTATGEPLLAATRELRHFEASLLDYVGFNTDRRRETGRVEVRQAISYAINRVYITEDIMRGPAVASTLPFHPSLFYYDELPSEVVGFDLAFARRILAGDATLDGFGAEEPEDEPSPDPATPPPLDIDADEGAGEGDETDEASSPRQLSFLVASGNTNRMEVAVYIAASIAELGFQVVIDDRPYNEFIQALNAGDFDLYYGQVRLQADFDLSELLFGNLAFGGTGNLIPSRLHDDFLASGQSDRGERAARLSRAILTEVPFTVIGFRHLTVATQRGVVIGMQPTQENLYNNVWEWIVNLPSETGA